MKLVICAFSLFLAAPAAMAANTPKITNPENSVQKLNHVSDSDHIFEQNISVNAVDEYAPDPGMEEICGCGMGTLMLEIGAGIVGGAYGGAPGNFAGSAAGMAVHSGAHGAYENRQEIGDAYNEANEAHRSVTGENLLEPGPK